MSDPLTQNQKALLRWLMQAVKVGNIPPTFLIVWTLAGGRIVGQVEPPPQGIAPEDLDALVVAGMLVCTPGKSQARRNVSSTLRQLRAEFREDRQRRSSPPISPPWRVVLGECCSLLAWPAPTLPAD